MTDIERFNLFWLCHAMTAHPREKRSAVASRFEAASQHSGSEIASDGEPRALGPLAAIVGIFAGHALSPAVAPIAVGSKQQDAATGRTPETRLKKMDEWHVNLAERDGFNLHLFRKALESTTEARRLGEKQISSDRDVLV